MLNSHFIPEDYELYLNSESLNSEEEIKKFYKRRFEKIKFCVGSELEALKH